MAAPRSWVGLAVAVVGLAGLTALLARGGPSLSLAGVGLLYLVPVVAAAVIGGVGPALVAAVAAVLLVNFFFIPPYHTLLVDSRDQFIVLVVYVGVAAAVSVAVEVAARQRVRAVRREAEAAVLAQATAEPVTDRSLTRLLDQVRRTFALTAVALLESGPTGEHPVATVGRPPATRPMLSAPAGNGLRLAAWGPDIVDDDRRTLHRLAAAAARILEAQRLTDQANQARDLAEIDRVRAALLAAVGHDLRTPLAGVKAAVSSLRQPDLDLPADARAELLATIDDATDQLATLVDNLLSMGRLQAGVLSVDLQPVALDGVVGQALLDNNPHTSTPVEIDVPDDLPLIHADPGLLERVIANLVSNAHAASPAGRPVLLRGHTSDGDPGHVHLQVIDHGPGVPQADRDRIFQPFQRLHDRSTTGLGLGLAIARGFADAMNATITPTETPGGGLTMTLTLPIATLPVTTPAAGSSAS